MTTFSDNRISHQWAQHELLKLGKLQEGKPQTLLKLREEARGTQLLCFICKMAEARDIDKLTSRVQYFVVWSMRQLQLRGLNCGKKPKQAHVDVWVLSWQPRKTKSSTVEVPVLKQRQGNITSHSNCLIMTWMILYFTLDKQRLFF